MKQVSEHRPAGHIKERLAAFGLIIDDETAASVEQWAVSPLGIAIIEGPPGCGKLTLAETYAEAMGLTPTSHSFGVTGSADWQGSELVIVEDVVRRLARAGHVEELRELVGSRAQGPGGRPTPLVIFTSESPSQTDTIARILNLTASALPTRINPPSANQQAAILAHRIPGIPDSLISDCLALAAEINEASILEHPLCLRDILRMAKLFKASSADSITPDNFDTALDVLPKTQGEFTALSGARLSLLEGMARRQAAPRA